MVTNAEKELARIAERLMIICNVELIEEVEKNFLSKFQKDKLFKEKIAEDYNFVIEFLEECLKFVQIDEKTRQIFESMLFSASIDSYTKAVYEILCRIAILECIEDDVTSLKQFYEESISWAKTEYIYICMNRISSNNNQSIKIAE